MTQSHANSLPPDRCSKCDGFLEFVHDPPADYTRCFDCGRYTYVIPDREEAPRRRNNRGWFPTTQACQERYREIRETVFRRELSVAEAAQLFGVSKRTIYRALDGEPPPA